MLTMRPLSQTHEPWDFRVIALTRSPWMFNSLCSARCNGLPMEAETSGRDPDPVALQSLGHWD